jgi:CDP-diacylglycerol--glycerol-3-phosphate 3-phosphatidyltransferase
MNLPNLLTLIRVALIPVFIACYYPGAPSSGPGASGFAAAAFVVFVAASLTDAADGHIARSRGLVTNFGKLMDPLADKALTTAAFICFVDTGAMPAWMAIVILSREFLITGLRGVAASEGVVIAAGRSGKVKTVAQMAFIALCLLCRALLAGTGRESPFGVLETASAALMWIALAVTVYSGVEYMWRSRSLLKR